MDKDEDNKDKMNKEDQKEDNQNQISESGSDKKEHSENSDIVDYYENMRNIGKTISEALSSYMRVSDYMSSYKESILSAMKPIQEAMASVAAINTSNVLREYSKTIDMSYVSEILGQITKPVITDALPSVIDMIPDYSKMLGDMFVATDSLREIAANMQNALQVMNVDLSSIMYDEDFDDEYDDDLLDLIETIAKGDCNEETINEENEKSDGKLKKYIIRFLLFVLAAIISGYIQRLSEPVYKVLDELIIHKDADVTSEKLVNVPADAEITIWGYDVGDYVEVSYDDGNEIKQGYILKDTLKNNTILIKEGVGVDQLAFTDYCIDLMADYWGISSSEAYKKLSEDTELVENFLIPNYAVLSTISDDDLIKEIETEYGNSLKED